MPADPITVTCPSCSRVIKVPLLNADITPETYAQVHRYAQRADGGRSMNESEEALLSDLERAHADLDALRLEHDAWGVLLDAARRDRDEARRERDGWRKRHGDVTIDRDHALAMVEELRAEVARLRAAMGEPTEETGDPDSEQGEGVAP